MLIILLLSSQHFRYSHHGLRNTLFCVVGGLSAPFLFCVELEYRWSLFRQALLLYRLDAPSSRNSAVVVLSEGILLLRNFPLFCESRKAKFSFMLCVNYS